MFLSLAFWVSGPFVGFLVRCCFLELLRNRELISGQLHKVSSSRLSFLVDPVRSGSILVAEAFRYFDQNVLSSLTRIFSSIDC